MIITALLATVTYLFVQSSALDPTQHLTTLRAMNGLNRVDAELGRNLLLMRGGLLLSYDPINRSLTEFHREMDRLPFADPATFGEFPDDIAQRYDAVLANVAQKEELVERFKSRNALMRNSWAYFTQRSYAIVRQENGLAGQGELAATIAQLSALMLRVFSDPAAERRVRAGALLTRLEESPVSPDFASSVDSVVRNGRLILNLSPDLDGTLRTLLASPTGELVDNLRNAYLEYHRGVEESARKHRMLLYVLSVLLLVYLIYLFYRVQAGARTLSDVNDGLIRQIAERKHAEQEARQLQSEIAHVHRLSTMGEMATGLAHELNQPLAAITSYAHGCVQRLRAGKTNPEELLDVIDRISLEAGRAAGIIRRIRNFVRKGRARWARIDVNAAIRETAELLAAEAHRHRVRIALDLTDPVPTVMADTIQIQQTLLNLMRNAIEAMDEHDSAQHRLTIRTFANENSEIEVTVEDTGPGVPAHARQNIFDPFFTTKESGLGLGLPICRSIIEAHGGRLWATGDNEHGAVFHFTLPIVDGGKNGQS